MASQNEQDGAAENRSAENEKESGETTTSTMASTGTATDSITVSPPQATTASASGSRTGSKAPRWGSPMLSGPGVGRVSGRRSNGRSTRPSPGLLGT